MQQTQKTFIYHNRLFHAKSKHQVDCLQSDCQLIDLINLPDHQLLREDLSTFTVKQQHDEPTTRVHLGQLNPLISGKEYRLLTVCRTFSLHRIQSKLVALLGAQHVVDFGLALHLVERRGRWIRRYRRRLSDGVAAHFEADLERIRGSALQVFAIFSSWQ